MAGLRRDGRLFLALTVAGTTGAVWVSWRFSLPVAATVAALLPSVGGMFLSWAAFRNAGAEQAAALDPAALADRLAVEVRAQWEAELTARQVTPYVLDVSWRPADAEVGEPWDLLRRTARGWPGGPPGSEADWAAGPEGLAGRDGELAEVFLHRIPTRRLVVLGEPGSGKTVLLIRLLLALAGARSAGGPVPVLLPLASWDPATLSFQEWTARRLARDFTVLDTGTGYGDRGARARALVEAGLVLPLLDGLDELPRRSRADALEAIGRAWPPGRSVVLSSRTAAYRDTAAPAGRLPARLAGAAAVEVRPVEGRTAADYLVRGAGGPGGPAAARWQPVLDRLAEPATSAPASAPGSPPGSPPGSSPTSPPASVLGSALSTPLMLSLATTVYNARPGEDLAALPDPADLCDRTRLPDRRAVERHLLGAGVPAAYRAHPRHSCRWTETTAARALRFLATHLERDAGGSTELAWWRLRSSLPRHLVAQVTGVLLGLMSWTAALLAAYVSTSLVGDVRLWWVVGAPSALVAGMAAGLACGVGAAMTAGLTSTTASTVAFWLVDPSSADPRFPADHVPVGGLAFGFAAGLIGSLVAARADGPPGGAGRPWSWDWTTCLCGLAAGGALWFPCSGLGAATALTVAALNALVYATAGGLLGRAATRTGPAGSPAPATRLRWSFDRRAFLLGLAAGPAFAGALLLLDYPAAVLAHGRFSLADTPRGYVLSTCLDGLGLGLAAALRARPADPATSPGPTGLLRQDRATFRHLLLLVGLGAGLALAAPYALSALVTGSSFPGAHLPPRPGHLLAALPPACRAGAYALALAASGLVVGLAAAIGRTACWPYAVTRAHLFLRHRLPPDLTAFLADAHRHHAVLRRAGAVYQFRHLELQHHLTHGTGTAPCPRPDCCPSPAPVTVPASRSSS